MYTWSSRIREYKRIWGIWLTDDVIYALARLIFKGKLTEEKFKKLLEELKELSFKRGRKVRLEDVNGLFEM
jgi:hypothetical protein